MNKKLLISLGSLSTIAVVAPILATVSCASDAPVDANNLIITAKPSPSLTNEDIKNLEATGDNSTKWSALEKLFEGPGFTPENKDKFTVSIHTGKKIVTLLAVQGYKINGNQTFASSEYKMFAGVNIIITPKANPDPITTAEVATLKGTNASDQLVVLKKLFEGAGLVNTNQPNFTITVNETTSKVTLKAKEGFLLNNKQYIEVTYTLAGAKIPLNFTLKPSPVLTAGDVFVLKAPSSSNLPAQLTALNKLFNGITKDNQEFFTVAINTPINDKVILRAKEGYVFGANSSATATTIVSNVYTVA
ncbi:MAG: hypothetical protein ACRCRP_00535 [Metamycoplasmataceae bacterium]